MSAILKHHLENLLVLVSIVVEQITPKCSGLKQQSFVRLGRAWQAWFTSAPRDIRKCWLKVTHTQGLESLEDGLTHLSWGCDWVSAGPSAGVVGRNT